MRKVIRNVKIISPLGNTAVANHETFFLEIDKGAVFIEDGLISDVRVDDENLDTHGYEEIDGKGKLLTPGLIDSHTHLVFGGWRYNEVPLKLAGVEYLEILKQGGGILSTVRSTRNATSEELYDKGKEASQAMLKLGVTTVEAKSGYGLSLEEEIKQLEVAQKLHDTLPIDIVSTFMGAHAIPPEFENNNEAYVDLVCNTMIPAVAEKGLAEFIDVFCEDSVFNVEESRKILLTGKKHGFTPKIHADEIMPIGGSELAGEVGAITAEHLIAIDEKGIKALEDHNVIACLLPATSFYLGADFAPARKMMEHGIPVAIATDYNPGSCPSLNIQLAMNIAYLRYKMTAKEILCAVTLNAAAGIHRATVIGSIEKGKIADLVLWDVDDVNMLIYRMGINQVSKVYKKGINVNSM